MHQALVAADADPEPLPTGPSSRQLRYGMMALQVPAASAPAASAVAAAVARDVPPVATHFRFPETSQAPVRLATGVLLRWYNTDSALQAARFAPLPP
jgi:hypothetical protein